MPTVYVTCDSCNTQHETTFWAADRVCKICKQCANDICEDCEVIEENPDLHKYCLVDYRVSP
jgi:hypothetical protein